MKKLPFRGFGKPEPPKQKTLTDREFTTLIGAHVLAIQHAADRLAVKPASLFVSGRAIINADPAVLRDAIRPIIGDADLHLKNPALLPILVAHITAARWGASLLGIEYLDLLATVTSETEKLTQDEVGAALNRAMISISEDL